MRDDKNWEMLNAALAAEATGKQPRLFSSRRTLFGIPSALDAELEQIAKASTAAAAHTAADSAKKVAQDRQGGGANIADVSAGESVAAAASAGGECGNTCTAPLPQHALAGAAASPAGSPASKAAASPVTPAPPTRRETPAPAVHRAPTAPHMVRHPLEPVYDAQSRVLILGTMPSPKSRELGFYYAHPQNRFWPALAGALGCAAPEATTDARRAFAIAHKIALWDVLASCTIEGARDATIANCVPNNISLVTANSQVSAVFCTGAKAFALYEKYCQQAVGLPAFKLPSPSAANAATSLAQLTQAYRTILPHLVDH